MGANCKALEGQANPSLFPADTCIHHLVAAQAARTPHAPAIIQAGKQLSYAELDARADHIASLLHQLANEANAPIGVALRPSLNLPVALLGVLKAGCACLPLDLNYPQERLQLMLKDAQPAALLSEESERPALAFAETRLVCLDSHEPSRHQPATGYSVESSAETLAYVIYTSGSTGKPRGVLLPHRGLVNHNLAAIELYGLRPSDRVLQFSSISFDIAIEEIFPALMCGAAVVLKDADFSLQAGEFLGWIERRGVTVLDLPTAFWHELVYQLEAAPELALPPCLRLVILGGEKASTKAYRVWEKVARGRVRLINTYGPTEASVIVTAFEPARFPQLPLGDSLPLGSPVAGAQIHLLDENLKPVAEGETGELYIGGPPLANGYLNNAASTAQKFIPNPFSPDESGRLYKTGDRACYSSPGILEFIGRVDFQLKIQGFRVEPGEIEAVLHEYPGLAQAVVVGHEYDHEERKLVAYVVWSAGQARASHDALRDFLRSRLPQYMIPATIVDLDRMPMSVNGKVDRRALPKPDFSPAAQFVGEPPRDDLEGRLLVIWQAVLRNRTIGVRDNFFEVGGHSLLAARLMHRVGQAAGGCLPLALLFQAPTVEKLAAALRNGGWTRHWSSLVPIQPSGSKPPLFCVHGVGGNVLNFRTLSKHMWPDFPLYGLQAQGLDGKQTGFETLGEMAALYIKEIRSVQPGGPYFVGGYSLGGLIAYEMARQLTESGEEVALVALLDTYPGTSPPATRSLLSLLLSPTRLFTDMPAAAFDSLRRRIIRGAVAPSLKKVFRQNAAAGDQYCLHPYAGTVALFRAAEKSWRSSGDPYQLWTSLAPNLEIHEIPGDHRGILYEPQVAELAACLKRRIGEIAAEYETAKNAERIPADQTQRMI